MMATSVRNLSSPPKVVKAQAPVQTSLSDWPVGDFFSQNPKKVTAFLGRVMYDRNQIIHNIGTDTPFMDQYEKNTQALRRHIVQKSEHIKGQFKSPNVVEASRSDFIHVICDTAHTYQGRTGDEYSRLFTAANYLLEKKTSRLATDSRANMGYFLNPAKAQYPIQTIYAKTASSAYAEPALASETFGNILFRMTPTDDIVFSPVFLHYLNTKQVYIAQIPPQQATWEALKDDETLHGLGYKKLTDRDAVAHYRWLTENASGEEFTAYLTRIGHASGTNDYPFRARKTLLADLSKQYWHLGHGSIPHPSAAVEGTHFQGTAVPLNLVHPHVTRHQDRELSRPCTPISVERVGMDHTSASDSSSENPDTSEGQFRTDASSGYSADSENNETQLQSQPPKTHPRRPRSLTERRHIYIATSRSDASSVSENSDKEALLYPSFRRNSRKGPHRNSRAGHGQSLPYVQNPLRRNVPVYPARNTRQDHRYTGGLWEPLHTAVPAPSESRKRKPEQPPMESTFRYIAPRYVERITYMEPEKIIRPLYYIPVIQKRQKDMAYKIGSFFKKLFFAIRMR